MSTYVGSLLKKKGSLVHTAAPGDKVSAAVRRMAELEIGALPVLEFSRLVGIISERDVLNRIVDRGLQPDATTVAEVMTPSPRSIGPAEDVHEAMRLMSKGRFRHLPVLDGQELIGLISIRDAMEWVIHEQNQVINTMLGAVKIAPASHRPRK